MPKASPILTAFNAGELSPLLYGRVDIAKYSQGCRTLENFLPTIQGAAKRRPGTKYAGAVKTASDRTWLMPFQFNVEQAYVLEWGALYVRFWLNHGQLISGTPVEVVTPYSAADLTNDDGTFALGFVQSADVLYVTHPSYPTRKLERLSATSWTFTVVAFEGGPFKDRNTSATTVYASAATGAGITITASAGIFTANHVGSLFRIEEETPGGGIAPWEAGKVVAVNDQRRSDGKTYVSGTAATTGSVKPTHSEGAASDGAVSWTYRHAGYGWVTITGYTSATQVTATVVSRLPDAVVGAGNPTTKWSHGAFSDEEGYPSAVTFFRERLTLAKDTRIYCSVSGDFENFAAKTANETLADNAVQVDITSDQVNLVQWLSPEDALVVGTAGGEFVVGPTTTTEAFGPGNVKVAAQTRHGSRAIVPVRVGDAAVFVQRAGRKLREFKYEFQVDTYIAPDVTVLSEHVTQGGVEALVYQQEPDSVIWAVRADGVLLSFTYNREQDVLAWARHVIGGSDATEDQAVVESVAAIPAPDGDADELWMIVRRQIDGATVRTVEYLMPGHRTGDDQDDGFYVDCGATLDNTIAATLSLSSAAVGAGVIATAGSGVFALADVGRIIVYRYADADAEGGYVTARALITGYTSATVVTVTVQVAFPSTSLASGAWRLTVTTVSGLDHLEGETVAVLADGAAHPDRTVSGGAITLQTAASKVHVGLPYTSTLETMRPEAGSGSGTAQGKTKRIHDMVLRLHETLGGKTGPSVDKLDALQFRSGSDPMDRPPHLFTGDIRLSWRGGYDRDALIVVRQDQPLPMTVVAIMPQLLTND